MRHILLLLNIFAFLSFSQAQTVPAGVGNSANNTLWLDASSLTLSDGDPVSSWTDQSAYGNDAVQANASNQPLFRSSQINGKAAIEFVDGGYDYLNFTNNIQDSNITVFMVFQKRRHNPASALTLGKHEVRGSTPTEDEFSLLYTNKNHIIGKPRRLYSIFGFSTSTPSDSGNITYWNNNNITSESRSGFLSNASSSIGGPFNGKTWAIFIGYFAEIIIYNEALSSAERRIVSEYLAAKYDLISESSIYAFRSTHGENVKGIGQELDGSNLSAQGQDSLEVSDASNLSNGDYMIIGSDGNDYSTSSDVPAGVVERWNRTWKADITGNPGTVDLTFYLGSNGFSSISNYTLLTESDDGDFSNGGTDVLPNPPSYSVGNNSITFNNVTLNDGDVFTLAELDGGIISSVASDSWNLPTTWSCGCIPDEEDIVHIVSPHTVSIDANASVLDLTVENGASLDFGGSDTLSIYRDLTFQSGSSFLPNNGTIEAVSPSVDQFFNNTTTSQIDLNNLLVSNSSVLNIGSGGWAVNGNLQVLSGELDVSLADSMVLVSNATYTSQILPSIDNAFTGDFTIERYISSRNAGFGDFSSPIENATFVQLDDDLYISGAGGADGNATVSGGSTFYSLYEYHSRNDDHDSINNINKSMLPARGYEVYLASNLNTFNETVVDFVGTPNSGNVMVQYSFQVNRGWNLLGNPYHSFIDWSQISISATSNTYYIFDTDAGTYQLKQPTDPIAPAQGFWVFQSNGGGYYPTFTEAAKVNSSSPTFLRKKNLKFNDLAFKLTSKENGFNHTMRVKFNEFATENIDEQDVTLLKSPIKEAPAIYSKAKNSNVALVENSINTFESAQVLPLSIYAGVEGNYEIKAENVSQVYDHYSCIYLKDNKNGEAIDLNLQDSYAFEANQGKSDRFSLVLSNSFQECEKMLVKDGFEQKLEHNLSLRNAYDQWYLDYTLGQNLTQVEIHIYNMNGQEVLNPTSFSASDAGSYRINGLSKLEGIFMIQIKSKDEIVNKTVKL